MKPKTYDKLNSLFHNKQYNELLGQWDSLSKSEQQGKEEQNLYAATLLMVGDYANALKILEPLAEVYSEDVLVLSNLAQVFHGLDNIDQTLSILGKVLYLDPTHESSLQLYVAILIKLGRVNEAGQLLQRSIQALPHSVMIQYNMSLLYFNLLAPQRWPQAFELVASPGQLSIFQHIIHCQHQLIAAWVVRADLKEIKQALSSLERVLNLAESSDEVREQFALSKDHQVTINSAKSYAKMFRLLLEREQWPLSKDDKIAQLYLIGDSHSLPAHGQKVSWQNKPYQLNTLPVVGLKLHHIKPDRGSLQYSSLLARISQIPKNVPVVFSAGEIDCRIQRGIWSYAEKSGRSLAQVIQDTVEPAVVMLRQLVGDRPAALCGVPALTNIVFQKKGGGEITPKDVQDKFAKFVYQFNLIYRAEAHKHGFSFIDLHAATRGKGYYHNERETLDGRHYDASFLPEMIRDYCSDVK